MQCPNCHRENKPNSRFCIHCGTILPPTEAKRPAETPADVSLQSIQDEVRHLRETVELISNRLITLERQGVVRPEARPTQPVVPATEAISVPTIIEAPTPYPTRPKPAKPAKAREWELILGGNWLAKVGVLALIIGIAFLIKLAADNSWVNPAGWLTIGILVGLAMLGGGYYWRKRYTVLAQALSGGGIAILYISIFAAFSLFHLIPFYPAVGLLLLFSIGSAGLAIWYNSMALAIIGILGAFCAPFILGIPGQAGLPTGQGIQLLVYIIVVDIGVLALSTFRNWRWFTLVALVGSLVSFGIWHGQYGNKASLLTSELSLTIVFLIFVGATMLYHYVWRRRAEGFDYVLMIVNAAAYFGISYGLMWHNLRELMGGFSLVLALFYGGLAYAALRRGAENIMLSYFALGIAIVFLTIAIPVQLGDKAWTTIAWAAEFVVFMWLSLRLNMPQFRLFSYGAFALMAIRLLFYDSTVNVSTYQPVLNERVLAFVIGIAATYLAAYLLWRQKETIPDWSTPASTLLIAANFFTVWLLSFEVWNYFGKQLAGMTHAERIGAAGSGLRSAQTLSLTAVWALYAAVALVIGIVKRSRLVRLGALGLLAVAIVKVFVYDVFALEQVYRIIAFTGLGVLLIVSAYLYQRYSKVIKVFLVQK